LTGINRPHRLTYCNDTYTAFCVTLEAVKCLIIQLLDDEQAQYPNFYVRF